MKIYAVGGQVRDEVLGRNSHDRDYVVVGATPEDMLALGYTQVGADFPVFLHPETKEEYALARTERKTGVGHKGFETFYDPDVTIEEDLGRRDLTINSMAKDLETGEIIDPYNGMADCRSRTLRHTTDAFKEDPLRILRLFRFQAQLGSKWCIAAETMVMVIGMANAGMLKEIPAERKWKEMEKANNTAHFAEYIHSLSLVGELPELMKLRGVEQPAEHHPEGDAFLHTILCLAVSDRTCCLPQVKFAVLCHDFGKYVSYKNYGNLYGHEAAGVPLVRDFCERLKVPNDYRNLALKVTEFHTKIHSIQGRGDSKASKPKSVMKLFEDLGVVGAKKREFLEDVLYACQIDARGRTGKENSDYPQMKYVLKLWDAMMKVRTKDISLPLVEKGASGVAIGEAIRVARINAIRGAMKNG